MTYVSVLKNAVFFVSIQIYGLLRPRDLSRAAFKNAHWKFAFSFHLLWDTFHCFWTIHHFKSECLLSILPVQIIVIAILHLELNWKKLNVNINWKIKHKCHICFCEATMKSGESIVMYIYVHICIYMIIIYNMILYI